MLTPALLPLTLLCLLSLAAGMADLVLMFLGTVEARRWKSARLSQADRAWLLNSALTPPIAVLAAPSDASAASRARIRKLLQLHSADVQFVVMLEDPSGSDLAVWMDEFHLQPAGLPPVSRAAGSVRATYESNDAISLLVVETEKGRPGDSLNIGLQFAGAPVIAAVDLSAEYHDEALMMMLPFLEEPAGTAAVCAAAPPARAAGFLSRLFRLDFQCTWLMRCGLSKCGVVLPSPGGIALFRREAVVRAGGFGPTPLELILRIQKLARHWGSEHRVIFLPIPASRPKAPTTQSELKALLTRDRADCAAAFDRHGWLALHEFLRLLYRDSVLETAAVVMAAMVIAFHWADPVLTGLLLAAVFAFKVLESMTAVFLADFASPAESAPGDLCRQFLGVVAASLVYRLWRDLWAIGQIVSKVQPKVQPESTNWKQDILHAEN